MSSSIIIKKPGATLSLQGGRSQRPRVPGVFPASQFGEQVVSTGIPSLDGYIGGGILLGSIVLISTKLITGTYNPNLLANNAWD